MRDLLHSPIAVEGQEDIGLLPFMSVEGKNYSILDFLGFVHYYSVSLLNSSDRHTHKR